MKQSIFSPDNKHMRVLAAGLIALVVMNALAAWPRHGSSSPEIKQVKPAQIVSAKLTSSPKLGSKQYLVIKEWGVKIPLNSDLADLSYAVRGEEVRFSTPSLMSHGCRADSIGLPFGLLRTDQKFVTQAGTRDLAETSFKQVSGHWFSVSGAQAICFDHPPSDLPTSVAQSYERAASAIEQALRQLQPA